MKAASLELSNLRSPMGRYLKQYDKDNMRMAMLKQEEIFRDQVHELHRLYRVQKLLMDGMKADIKRQRKSFNSGTKIEGRNIDNETASQQPHYSCQDQRRPRLGLNLDLQAEEYIGNDDKDVTLDVNEDNDLELTLATGSWRRGKKENSFTSDSGASFSSSSAESGAKMKLNGNKWGGFRETGINLGNYQRERKTAAEDRMREERVQQPPWLFHCLSLNMT